MHILIFHKLGNLKFWHHVKMDSEIIKLVVDNCAFWINWWRNLPYFALNCENSLCGSGCDCDILELLYWRRVREMTIHTSLWFDYGDLDEFEV